MLDKNAILHVSGRDEASPASGNAWFVYLLPLYDETSFKVGFSRSPLQRIHSFTHRYFERFDLNRSVLLQVSSCARARAIEGTIKKMLVEFRIDAPSWVLDTAGGDTEWFAASEFERACEHVSVGEGLLLPTFAFLQASLRRSVSSFEFWAIEQAKQLENDAVAVSLGHDPRITSRTLNDWMDAFSYFDIELFVDDRAAFEFVKARVRLSPRNGLP